MSVVRRKSFPSHPDPAGRTPEKHDGHARDGWQAYVYGSGKAPEQGYRGRLAASEGGSLDLIMKTGILEDGELDPNAKSVRIRKEEGMRMTKKRRAEINARLKGKKPDG